jgi:hypothetical protein
MKAFGTAAPIFPNTTGTAARNSRRSLQKPNAPHNPSLPPGKIVGSGCRRSSTRAISWLSQ